MNDTDFDARVRAADPSDVASIVRELSPAEATRLAGRWSTGPPRSADCPVSTV
jgi:hypothetical protein